MTTARSPEEVGRRIRERRLRKQLRQDGLTGLVSSSTIRKIETGAADGFSDSTLYAVAEWLGLPFDFYERLMAGEEMSELVAEAEAARTISRLRHPADDGPEMVGTDYLGRDVALPPEISRLPAVVVQLRHDLAELRERVTDLARLVERELLDDEADEPPSGATDAASGAS